MNIKLRLVAPKKKDDLAVLVNDYLKIHCQHQSVKTGPETVDDYIYFPEYWRELGRFPYFICLDDRTLGFVLVRTVFEKAKHFYQVSDFYITPENHRQGFGKHAVNALWKKHPGEWELQVLGKNTAAREFWSNCTASYATGETLVTELKEDDGTRYQYNFATAGVSAQ